MALGTAHIAHNLATGVGEASAATTRAYSNSPFIRELWTDEMIASYKTSTVMPGLVHRMPFTGQKGDTVHVPVPARGVVTEKALETAVNYQALQSSQKQYLVDQHWYYATLIEDIIKIQADDSLRAFITDDAGFQLAKKIDTDLHAEGAKFAGADAAPTVEGTVYSKAVVGTPSAGALVAWDGALNTSEGNASVLTDEGIRLILKELNDNDVPFAGRVAVIPPVEMANLQGVSRFTEQAFVGEVGAGNTIRNGLLGNLYGVEIYVSTNCATVQDDGANGNERAALIFQKEALLHIDSMAPRVQSDYNLEYLGTAMVADMLYGTGVLRPEAGVAVVVPA